MAKKSGRAAKQKSVGTNHPQTTLTPVQFPPLVLKHDFRHHILEPDQIILIPDVFSETECKRYVEFIEDLPLELTPPPRKGEAERVNHRISLTSVEFSQSLFSILAPSFPAFPYPASVKGPSSAARPAHSLNSNIRLYKYTATQHFGPHYDDSVRDSESGAISEWTLLIYLSGVEDGVEGGETVFYKTQGKRKEEIRVPLRRGMVLLHRHGHECMLHEGGRVLKGVKYVLRSDVMFMQ